MYPNNNHINIKIMPLTENDYNYLKDNYMSYKECLLCLCIARSTLQQHIREGKRFNRPGDTLILPSKKRVFLKEAVSREVARVMEDNGITG
jgi:hypothetical protein